MLKWCNYFSFVKKSRKERVALNRLRNQRSWAGGPTARIAAAFEIKPGQQAERCGMRRGYAQSRCGSRCDGAGFGGEIGSATERIGSQGCSKPAAARNAASQAHASVAFAEAATARPRRRWRTPGNGRRGPAAPLGPIGRHLIRRERVGGAKARRGVNAHREHGRSIQ